MFADNNEPIEDNDDEENDNSISEVRFVPANNASRK